jgi:hypothetical protein
MMRKKKQQTNIGIRYGKKERFRNLLIRLKEA